MTARAAPVRPGGERGSAAVELTLVTPLLLLMALVVVAFGRLAGARLQVEGAAHDAARAASLARSPAAATRAAQQAATASLGAEHLSCAALTVAVETAAYRPGGSVAVTVSCTVDLSDLTLLHLPGHSQLSARFVSPLDTYRGVSG